MKLRKSAKYSESFFRTSMTLLESEILKNESSMIEIKSESFFNEEDVKTEPIFCEPLYAAYVESEKTYQEHDRKYFNQFKCDNCGIELASKSLLKKHLKSFHLLKVEECQSRQKAYSSAKKYKGYSKRHSIGPIDSSKNHQETFSCEICGKTFNQLNKLKRHMNGHLKTSNFENCHTKSLNSIYEKNPTKSSNNFICPICAKIFKSKSNLSQHEKTHKILMPNEYFYCDLCGNKFKEKTLMMTHIKNRHIKKIRFNCELCDKNYATKFHLSTHMKVNHFHIKDFKCEYCGKEFGEKKKLVAHVRIHTGEQPFQVGF